MESRPSARVIALRPLLRAGLERIAAASGVEVVTDAAAATDFSLRTSGEPPDGSPIDVSVTQDAVVITCHGNPDAALWETLRSLVANTLIR